MSEDLSLTSTPSMDKQWLSPSEALTTVFTDETVIGHEQTDTELIDGYGIIINDLRFVIASAIFCQIAKVTVIDKLLNAPPWVAGLSNVSGSIVPIFDLSVYFGLSSKASSNFPYMLLIGKSEKTIGILTDKLPNRLTFYADQKSPPPPIPELLIPFVPCSYITNNSKVENGHDEKDNFWLELDIEKLLVTLKISN